MQKGQKMFYDFIMERVQEDSKDHAQTLLMDNFQKLDNNTFVMEDILKFHDEIVKDLKPEHVEEVLQVIKQFGR